MSFYEDWRAFVEESCKLGSKKMRFLKMKVAIFVCVLVGVLGVLEGG